VTFAARQKTEGETAQSAERGEPPARVPLDKTFHRKVLSPLLRFFEKRAFRRQRVAAKADRHPALQFHSREFEKDFVQSKLTIRSRRARGFAPHPTAFEKAGETSVFAQTSIRENI